MDCGIKSTGGLYKTKMGENFGRTVARSTIAAAIGLGEFEEIRVTETWAT
jgi:hypothetical protein